MTDSGLLQRSALASGLKPGRFGRQDGTAGVALTERKGLALASIAALAGQDAAVIAALEAGFGLAAPTRPQLVTGERLALSWTGPGQWLALADAVSGDLAAALTLRLNGLAAVTDQSDGWVILRLSGPLARAVLMKCLTIDLDPRVFRPGDVALTRAGHLDLRVWHAAADVYDIACFRSYAAGLLAWLEHAALEFGLQVAA